MLIELIALGGWLFWILLGLIFFIEFIVVGKEKVWPTVIIPVVFLAFLGLFTSFDPIAFCKDSWLSILWSILGYVVFSCCFAIFKWYRRSMRRGRIYAHTLENWAEENMPEGVEITSINDIPIDKRMAFFGSLKDAYYDADSGDESYGRECWGNINEMGRDPYYDPDDDALAKEVKDKEHVLKAQKQVLKKALSSPKDNKERITVWMVAWPMSILTTFIFDFMYDFFGWLRKSLAGVFIKISRMGMGKYSRDFDNVKVEKEI